MAIAGRLVTLILDGKQSINPIGARLEKRIIYDTSNNPIELPVAVFTHRADEVADPGIIWAMPLPYEYSNGQGFSAQVIWAVEKPTVAGAVVWELSASIMRMNTSTETFDAVAWGTPTVQAANTVPTTAGAFDNDLITLTEANCGNAAANATDGTTAQFLFLRLRRKNSSASDTCEAPVLLFGVDFYEGI